MHGFRKQGYLLDFTLASMKRRKGRNLAILLVYSLVIFLLASVLFFTRSLRHEASAVLSGTPELTVQRLVAGRHALMPRGRLDAIRDIRGVASAEGRLWGYSYDMASRAT
jgi:hypothetical protein